MLPRYGPPMDDPDGYFGERVAATYDDSSTEEFAPEVVEATVGLLANLTGDGRALELGIGTGRIAVPLARRGVPVHGIDMSRAMVARLRAKPGGDAIDVTIGDFATTRVDGDLLPGVPGLQHDHEFDHAGRPGGVLPHGRRPPRPGAASSSR